MNPVLFSSKSNEWATPQDTFDKLNDEFHFTLDPCATSDNHKCDRFYTLENNGLLQDWTGERVFMNPPYSKEISKWMQKLAESNVELGVALVPARTDTKWFHNYVYGKCELRFIKGRLKFGNSKNSAPFPSMICIYRN